MDILWIGVAFILGLLVTRAHIPPLVGYLAAGIVLGLFGYEEGPVLKEIAHLGVIFLLFTVGLHIKLKNILQLEVLGVGLIHLLVTSAIFVPISLYFGLNVESAVIISLTLGFSSTVLTAKTLESRGELGAYYGRVSIGILIIQDLVAIAIIAYAGGGIPSVYALFLLLLPLFKPVLLWIVNRIERDELLLLMALALAIGGDSLFIWFNLSGELGALVFGMLLAGEEKGELLEKKIWGVKEAFLVGFFLQIGLEGLPDADGIRIAGLFLVLLLFKAVLFFLLFMFFRMRARSGFQATLSLTAYSEFTLIAGAVAVNAEIIPSTWIVILALLTAVSYAINAIIVKNEDRIWELLQQYLIRLQRSGKTQDKQLKTLGSAEYLVVGLGTAGTSAYDWLHEHDHKVVGMDIDPDKLERYLDEGRRVVYGDVQDRSFWEDLDMGDLKTILLAMSGEFELKMHAVKLLQKCGFSGEILVLALNERQKELFEQSGARSVMIPALQVGTEMGQQSVRPDGRLS